MRRTWTAGPVRNGDGHLRPGAERPARAEPAPGVLWGFWAEQRSQGVWESGWRNYSLFLREDGLLFGYLETEDFGRARAEMARREVNLRWQQEMAPFFEGLEGRRPDEGMVLLEEVFHLD